MIPIQYNIRSLAERKTTTVATALGVALVVFVLSSALMLSEGITRTLTISGRSDNAIVLRKGSDSEMGSVIDAPQVNLIQSMPGVRKEGTAPIAIKEVVVALVLEKLGVDGVTNVQVRGVPDNVFQFRSHVRMIEGRQARPGSQEAIVGKAIRGRFRGIELNQSFELRKNRPVQIVGVFEDGGSSYESEVWVDLDTLRSAFGIEGSVSSVRVRLESPSKFDVFRAAVGQDKRLGLEASTERAHFEKLSEGTAKFVSVTGTLVSVFFAIGAMIGAMITMYAAVASRQREIGTLRALGFPRTTILLSFLLESILLCAIGGAVGTLASLAMGTVRFSMVNFASFAEVVFEFKPTPGIIVTSLVFACVMGLLGGFFPALRAARTSPVTAMRG